MRQSGFWLDLATAGLLVVAFALAAWYRLDAAFERTKRMPTSAIDVIDVQTETDTDPHETDTPRARGDVSAVLAAALAAEPRPPAEPRPAPEIEPKTEAEQPVEAEEILFAAPGSLIGASLQLSRRALAGARRAGGGRRWIMLVSVAGVLLLLAAVGFVVFIPLMLWSAVLFVGDSSRDVRLRLIVVVFVVDLALQVVAAI